MSRRGKAWLVCHFCIFMRMARFSLESLTTPRAIPSTTFTSSSLSFVSLSWAVLNSSNFFASPSTLRGASKVMKSDTGNNFAVDAGVGGCIDAAEGGPWEWGVFKAHTLVLSTWENGIDVPVGFICCSIGANIWPIGVDITWEEFMICLQGLLLEIICWTTSRGRSRICWGIPLPVRNWQVSWEKLLQLWFNRSYLQRGSTLHIWLENCIKKVIFELRPVPPEPVPSLGLQVLHEHPRVYLRLAHLQEAPSWQHLAPDDHYHLFYLKRLAELGASWVAALNATSPEEVFLQKVRTSDSSSIAALTWRPPCCGPQQQCARCLLVAGQSVVGRGFEPSLG